MRKMIEYFKNLRLYFIVAVESMKKAASIEPKKYYLVRKRSGNGHVFSVYEDRKMLEIDRELHGFKDTEIITLKKV